MADIREFLGKQPKWLLFVIGFFLVVIIGYIDYLTGEYSFLVFYLIPITLVICYVGCFEGVFIAVCSGVARYLTQYVFIQKLNLLYWNSTEDLVILVFAAFLIHLLKISLKLK
jgi:hypothetical protein